MGPDVLSGPALNGLELLCIWSIAMPMIMVRRDATHAKVSVGQRAESVCFLLLVLILLFKVASEFDRCLQRSAENGMPQRG